MRVFRILSFPSCIVLPFYFPLSLSFSFILLDFLVLHVSRLLSLYPHLCQSRGPFHPWKRYPSFFLFSASVRDLETFALRSSWLRISSASVCAKTWITRRVSVRTNSTLSRRGGGRGRAVPLPLVSIHRDAFTKGARAKKSQRSVSFPFVSSRQFLKDTMLRLFRRDKSALKREVYEGKNSYCWLYRGIAFAERLCLNMNRLFRIKPFLFCFEIK